ncbi:hypothetical protein B0A55_00814 [Friedmanniomyces simplex]|uniref:Uncharacterized protein n=1 Tax=Friedmanniomyces simplex TaxID=329884 RepID=A0A4U0Y3B4_9PEZI|nr:hypothetical protein B0A55_00814 [Friedmanniomyces simplex]
MDDKARSNRRRTARKTKNLICAITNTIAALLDFETLLQNDENDNLTSQTDYVETLCWTGACVSKLLKRLNKRSHLINFGDLDDLPEPDLDLQATLVGTIPCTKVCLDVGNTFKAYENAAWMAEADFAGGTARFQGWADVNVDLREALVEKNGQLNAQIDRWLVAEL